LFVVVLFFNFSQAPRFEIKLAHSASGVEPLAYQALF
jgi:hypothetical protein